MRKAWIICLLSGLFIFGLAALRPAEAKASEELISGQAYLSIHAAMAEFERQGLDISRYRIIVGENQTYRFVIFIDANVTEEKRLRIRGNPGKIPGFEVELTRDNFQIIRSNLIR
jgi:hypothetical protein